MVSPNERAFLAMIATAEGTERAKNPYAVCYGYEHVIADFRDHPAVTGEWMGERLPDDMCIAAGQRPGCVSTAAGRYQLIRPTWISCRDALRLPDFGADSQDRAALLLIERRGAQADVRAGRVAAAIHRVRREWASLPGAGWNQPERRISTLLAAFARAGGTVAA